MRYILEAVTPYYLSETKVPYPLLVNEMLGRRKYTIRCCGKVYRVVRRSEGRFVAWIPQNEYICTRCNYRGRVN